MPSLRKVLVGGGVVVAVVVVGVSLLLWLDLPSCTLQPPVSAVAPDGRFVAVLESRICSKPKDNWTMVTLEERQSGERAQVFKLSETAGPIAVRWVETASLEIRYPSGGQPWQSTRIQGWPTIKALIAD